MVYHNFAYYYDRLMEDVPYDQWMSYAKQQWDRLGAPFTVVDLACGTGSMSIPLAQQGLKVIGIDLSEHMLAIAREKKEQCLKLSSFKQGGELHLLCQDMREWQWEERVDSVICFCDGLNYLTEEADLLQTFQQVYNGLKPGGVFLFDVHTPQQLEHLADEQPFIYNEEDVAYIWLSELDVERSEIEHHITFFVREHQSDRLAQSDYYRRFEENHIQRAYPLSWIRQELLRIGFDDVSVTADFTNQAPDENTARAFFACKKPDVS